MEYDTEGHLQELHYAGAANKALSDADGVSGFRYERDEEGRAVKVTYLVCTKDGASATENDHYESIGTQNGLYSIRYTYSEEGDLSEIRYYGKDEVPMRYYKNAAAIRRSFSGHNMVEEQYCDQDDKPILNKERFAIDRIEYDEHGNPVKMSYYGPDGERILRTRNYAVSTRDYDDEGRIVRIGFYGLEEEPVLTEENFAACTYVYDDNGRKSEARYYGTDGELITNVVGFASVHFQYDDVGHVTRVDFYDTEAAPVCSAYGGASCVSEYDEAGNCTSPVAMDMLFARDNTTDLVRKRGRAIMGQTASRLHFRKDMRSAFSPMMMPEICQKPDIMALTGNRYSFPMGMRA